MIIAALIVYGLCLGSFVNALVWRVYEQERTSSSKKITKSYKQRLSLSKGRSMCPDCHHELTAKDLVPVLSWLSLGGKCRYCRKPISAQYPIVELVTSGLFVLSYVFWPVAFTPLQIVLFALWLLLLVGFMALFVYDARWMLLPSRIIYPMWAITAVFVLVRLFDAENRLAVALNTASAIIIGGGIFLLLYQVSKGKWIGGGDIRLGWIFGALVATPALSFMVIFIASLLGCIFALPSLVTKKLSGASEIPFGPFLIAATIIVFLFGADFLVWYMRNVLLTV